jgi:glycosyltransferase involved in cell wall biosynthesis
MASNRENFAVLVSQAQESLRRKLHVLILTPFYPSAGDEVTGCFVAELLEQLKSEDVTSTVMAVGNVYHPRKVAGDSKPAIWFRYLQFPGIVGLSSAGLLLHSGIRAKVRRLHQQRPIDLIHAHAALPCGDAAARLTRDLGVPFVVSVHGLDAFNACFGQGISVRWRRKASWVVYRQAAAVVCVSEKINQALTAVMGTEVRATTLYNGTDAELFSPDPTVTREEATLLVVGTLLRIKGQTLVLQAIAKLKDCHPLLRCLFIGDGPDLPLLLDLAKQSGIADRVMFVGRKNRAEVAAAMQRCTFFVLPSSYEGLGCVYLEAMASGMAVIACRGQGIEEIIRHKENGWLIGVEDLEELAQAISAMLQNPALRVEMGKAARRTILDGLTLEYQAKRMRSLYDRVIG